MRIRFILGSILGLAIALFGSATAAQADTVRPTIADVSYGTDPAQMLDIYRPAGAKAAPVVVMVHGGAWRFGDKAAHRVVQNKATHFLALGYVFVSVETRLLPAADVAAQADDVAAALAFVERQGAEWGADGTRLILMGHSAGGHLAALLSADPAAVVRLGGTPWRGTVVLDSAALNVPQTMTGSHYRLYDRAFGKDPAVWRALSPYDRLSGNAVPMLFVCSTRRSDSCPQANDLTARMRAYHVPAQVLPQDLSHGDVNGTLGLDGAYTQAVDAFIAGRYAAIAQP